MAEKPKEYIGEKGKRTTNTAEGFHGSALAYCSKRIDLNCLHYECETIMAILHKVTNISLTCNSIIVSKCQLKQKQRKSPFCCIVTEHRSSVDFSAHANDGCPHSILARQTMWEEQALVKTSKEYLKTN